MFEYFLSLKIKDGETCQKKQDETQKNLIIMID